MALAYTFLHNQMPIASSWTGSDREDDIYAADKPRLSFQLFNVVTPR